MISCAPNAPHSRMWTEGLSYPLLQQLLVQHPGKRIVVTGFNQPQQRGRNRLLGP